ncbi:hypothetical protein YC2023_004576 [Brassica napus]
MEGSPYWQFAFSWSWRRFLEPIPGYPILGILSIRKTGTLRSGSCLGSRRKYYLSIFPPTDLVNALKADITVARDQVEPDERLPPWWGLVGVGRRFGGEARSVCIKVDASAHTQDAYAAHAAILNLSSGRTTCRGQDPGILRGRILAM